MISLPKNTNIFLCTEPVDFRKGFDGLTSVVAETLGKNVTDGSLFLFVNRRRDRIKAMVVGDLTSFQAAKAAVTPAHNYSSYHTLKLRDSKTS